MCGGEEWKDEFSSGHLFITFSGITSGRCLARCLAGNKERKKEDPRSPEAYTSGVKGQLKGINQQSDCRSLCENIKWNHVIVCCRVAREGLPVRPGGKMPG